MTADGIIMDEAARAASLLQAQQQAVALFDEIGRTLIRPGVTESVIDREIFQLAEARYGVRHHWHKRLVRAGANTLATYADDPPDLVIQPDDILFVDLGPVFGAYEADFGRPYVLGDDPVKRKLAADVATAFAEGREYVLAHPDIRADELYAYACGLAGKYGWEFGGTIAGHIVGEFPHKEWPDAKPEGYINRENTTRLSKPDDFGRRKHWILEIHFVDRARGIGAFFEELATL
jgi:Xaa-Pro dipeptidase